MKCSLIVMVYNDIKTLTLTFEALKIQTEKEFEVIIADDGSNCVTIGHCTLTL